ncbi:MAG: DUF3152 domain-containing protein [Thermoleophilaceae bacterium]|nr:DUF3152 domain-containing protein [Thermoleophilaceae bacterium]
MTRPSVRGRSMGAIYVRRRRRGAAVAAGAGLAGVTGVLGLVAAIATLSSAEPPDGRTATEPAGDAAPGRHAARPVPPSDPLMPRSIRSTGSLTTVSGESPATDAPAQLFSVEVERGVAVDGGAFAAAVERTLLDRRSWAASRGFELRRVGDSSEPVSFRVTLASPETTDELCAPLQTQGTYSCHQDGRAVLNAERWARGASAYGRDLTGYRHYMVNHEVGHALGQSHVPCLGAGVPAPVMMQQTKGVESCRPNPWPLEDGADG